MAPGDTTVGSRPYGLDRLAARWDAPVVVCEGEKAADAAGLLFPNHVAVTSQGGSKAPGKADWTPLRGRAVTIWPDQDKAGADYAVTVADLAKQAGSASVRMVEVPPGWPEGWDLADDLPAGVAPGRLRELLDNSPEDTPPPAGDEDEPQAEAAPGTDPPAGAAELRALLSVEAWAERDIPAPDRLLGDLITRTTRMFLVGRTGLGKTLLGLAIAAGVASGKGFLDLPSSRPARVLYLDGEMPAELIKPRAADAMRRLGVTIPAENLLIFGRDIEAEARRVCPSLPEFGPLNTDDGGQFMLALLEAIGGVDLIIFDNVMSLIAGSMKDEEAWLATVPLVTWLTGKQIGQLWLDHTGHNTDRQYGTSTKAWQFDAVGQMTPVADEKPDPRATAFTLSFDYPGKARRRTPDNWAEFQARIIRLVDDQWVFEPVNPQADRKPTPLRPGARAQYDALLDALAVSPTPRRTTRTIWYAECVRLGLADAIGAEDTPTTREKKMGTFRAHLSQLKVAGWIGCDGETITSLKGAG